MAEEVRVRSVTRHGRVQELQSREHRWLADRAPGRGTGLGPTPLELLLGSFAARTGLGILDLAREKEWAVDSVEVEVALAEGGGADDPAPGGALERQVVVRGELDERERRELEGEVASRWPREGWLASGTLRERFTYP